MHPRSPLAPERFPDLPAIAGVRLAAGCTGMRYQGRDDLMVAELAPGSTVAGVFTRSLTASPPVEWCRKQVRRGKVRAIVVNAGNANTFTGRHGRDAVAATAARTAKLLGCAPNDVFVASTGVIGVKLPVEKIVDTLPAVQRALAEQDAWYDWRAKAIWHAAWGDQTNRWEVKLGRVARDLNALVDELVNQAQDDDVRFARRAKDLYRARVGVTYLLPPRGEDLESFYEQVRTRLLQHYVAQGRLRPTDTEAELLSAVLGAEGWKQAFQISVEEGPSHAYGHLRDLVKQEIKRLFRDRETGERPLLPPMADLLAQAAGTEGGGAVEEDDLAQFRQKLAGLVPNGFTPPGSGELKVLISYPGGVRDPIVESYLRDTIYLPRGVVPEFRAVDTETLVVVQFRTSMGVTEVPELRAVLQFWGQAMRREEPQDFLRWRQRLGYDFGYLVTTAEHRVAILHRLLCAMWNGQVRVDEGPIDSPRRILVSLEPEPGPDAPRMALTLVPYAGASSWGSLLRAYEDWALADDESFRRDFCAHLMRTVPDGISETPRPPDPLFETFLKMAGEQLTYLEEHLPRLSEHGRWQAGRLREFWSRTLPDALRLPFSGVASPMYGNLSDLYEEWR